MMINTKPCRHLRDAMIMSRNAAGLSVLGWLVAFASALIVFVGLLTATILMFVKTGNQPPPQPMPTLKSVEQRQIGGQEVAVRTELDPEAVGGVWRSRLHFYLPDGLPAGAELMSAGKSGTVSLPWRRVRGGYAATDTAVRWGETREYSLIIPGASAPLPMHKVTVPDLDKVAELLPSHPGADLWLASKKRLAAEPGWDGAEAWRALCDRDPFAPLAVVSPPEEVAPPQEQVPTPTKDPLNDFRLKLADTASLGDLAGLCHDDLAPYFQEELVKDAVRRVGELQSALKVVNDQQAQDAAVYLLVAPTAFSNFNAALGQQVWDYADQRMRFYTQPGANVLADARRQLDVFAANNTIPEFEAWQKRWKEFLADIEQSLLTREKLRVPPGRLTLSSPISRPSPANLRAGLTALVAIERNVRSGGLPETKLLDDQAFLEKWESFFESDRFLAVVSRQELEDHHGVFIPRVEFKLAESCGIAGEVEKHGDAYNYTGKLRWGDNLQVVVTNVFGGSFTHRVAIVSGEMNIPMDVKFWKGSELVKNYMTLLPYLNEDNQAQLNQAMRSDIIIKSGQAVRSADREIARIFSVMSEHIPALKPDIDTAVRRAVDEYASTCDTWPAFCDWRRKCLENKWPAEYFEGFPHEGAVLEEYVNEIQKGTFRVPRIRVMLEEYVKTQIRSADFANARRLFAMDELPPDLIKLAWQRCVLLVRQSVSEREMEGNAELLWQAYDQVFARCYAVPEKHEQTMRILIDGYDELKVIRQRTIGFWDPTKASFGIPLREIIRVADDKIDIEKTLRKWQELLNLPASSFEKTLPQKQESDSPPPVM